jgi:hypothetical protein
MRRNYGSLNLAALDLSSSSATIDDSRCHHQESFMLAHDLAHLDVSSEHDDCASAVGCPIESFAMMHDGDECGDAYARADAPRCRKRSLSEHGLGAEMRASSASITSTCSTASTCSNASSTGITIPVTSTMIKPSLQSSSYNHHSSIQKQHNLALDLPPRLVEQHHMELNALRCLSLNLMLSSSTPSGSGSSGMMTMPQLSTSVPKVNSFEFEIGCQPQTDRVTAALLAGRRVSLPRNMIQSV